MGRIRDQFGGVYRRCLCRKAGIEEASCPHPWYYRVRHGGEEVRRKVGPGPEGKKIAWQKVYELRGLVMREEQLGVRVVARATLEKFWPRLKAERERRLTPAAFRGYACKYRVAAGFFREQIHQIQPAKVEKFLNVLASNHIKASTRNRYLNVLSVAFKMAVEWGYAARNPAAGLKMEREEKVRPPRVTPAEVDAIVARTRHPEARAAIRLCYLMGLRRAEAAMLSRRSIDLEKRLAIFRGKGGKVRAVPLSDEALAVLSPFLHGPVPIDGDHLLFPCLGGPDGFTKAYKAAWRLTGLPRITLHHLRAAFVTGVLESGGSLTDARDLAGHSSVAVTDRYAAGAHADRLRGAVERFNRREPEAEKPEDESRERKQA